MSPSDKPDQSILLEAQPGSIGFYSPSSEVSMADSWFEFADTEHFWIRSRFKVVQKLLSSDIWKDTRIAEFGCGNGCMQRQIEDAYGEVVSGFDLNVMALSQSLVRKSPLFCYDVFSRKVELAGHFDIVILFDVIEHITNEKDFLTAVLYHLKPGGKILLNMPSDMRLYSEYDKAAGHIRRYEKKDLMRIAEEHRLTMDTWSYWGLPLYPLLMVRKLILRSGASEKETIKRGFRPPGKLVGRLLGRILSTESLPNHFLGTSIFGIFTKSS